MKTLNTSILALAMVSGLPLVAADKTFIDYFQPTPVVGSLVSNVWGAPGVFPRDPQTASKTSP